MKVQMEPSTMNVLLVAIIALQSWIIRELFKLKVAVALIHARQGRGQQANLDADA